MIYKFVRKQDKRPRFEHYLADQQHWAKAVESVSAHIQAPDSARSVSCSALRTLGPIQRAWPSWPRPPYVSSRTAPLADGLR